jgi:hypothetical protein
VEANAVAANTMEIAEASITPADEKKSEKKNYLSKAIIAKSFIINENKPTYEKAIADSKKSQWRESINKEIKQIHELNI